MKACPDWTAGRDPASTPAGGGPAPATSPCLKPFHHRRLLASLAFLWAALAATCVSGANLPLPRCEKGAQQLIALGEHEKARKALPREADSPGLRELVTRFSSRTINKKMISTSRAGHKVNVAVFQTGSIGAAHVAVLIHGCLTDHQTWRYVAGALGSDYELWLLDLPGCGESEGHPARLEPDAYTPTAMAERIGLVLEQCLAERATLGGPAPRLTLVGHSLGGTYVLRLLSAPALRERFAAVRRHSDALVLFAPCDVAVNCLPPSFAPLLSLTPSKIGLGRALGVIDRKIAAQTRRSFFLPECATREEAENFNRALTVPAHLRSAQAMVRSAVPWRLKENRPDWPAIAVLEADYANVDLPCLLAWGEWDETLTETMGHKIRDHVSGARLVEITGSGHSVVMEQPLACAHIIRAGTAAVEQGRFADLPPVCHYGSGPFTTPDILARQH